MLSDRFGNALHNGVFLMRTGMGKPLTEFY